MILEVNEQCLIFQSMKRRKIRIYIDLCWMMAKIIGKAKRCNYWALDSRWSLNNLNLTDEHSYNTPKSLVLFNNSRKVRKFSRKMDKKCKIG